VTSWSLVQRSPTDCGVSNMCDHETSTKRGGPGPYKAVEPYSKKKLINFVRTIAWYRYTESKICRSRF
jgi:hypothetical protein